MLFWIVILVFNVILLIKSTRGRMLHCVIVTDYEIGKEENREKQKENSFTLIHQFKKYFVIFYNKMS